MRSLCLLLVGIETLACCPKPAPSAIGPAAASPATVCRHYIGVLSGADDPAFQLRCETSERNEEAEGAAHWQCRSACILGAKTPSDVERCESQCALPPVSVNCHELLTASELEAELGKKVEAMEGTAHGSCVFRAVDGGVASVTAITHRTKADAVAGTDPQTGADVIDRVSLRGIGDAAAYWRAPAGRGAPCHLVVVKGRVAVSLSMHACTSEALERLATKISTRF